MSNILNAADYAAKALHSLQLRLYNVYNNALSGLLNSIKALRAYEKLEHPPYVVTEISDKEAGVGLEFNLDVSNNFGDINNNINRYNASGLPEGLTINSSSGEISGVPTTVGSFDVTVTVSDETGRSVKDKFEIQVPGLRQNLSPNQAETRFVSGKYINIVTEPTHKPIRDSCTKSL